MVGCAYHARYYPNPVVDKMNIRVGEDVAEVSVKVISSLGSVAFEGEYTDVSPFTAISIDLLGLAPGTYTVSVVMDGVEYKQQIVKL